MQASTVVQQDQTLYFYSSSGSLHPLLEFTLCHLSLSLFPPHDCHTLSQLTQAIVSLRLLHSLSVTLPSA